MPKKTFTLIVNEKEHAVEADPATPLLWVLREDLGLTGTKYGCGIAQCGACTVHLNGSPARSCVIRAGDVGDKQITTIEGLAAGGPHPVIEAWKEEQVPQCGYCQSGQIMQAAGLLAVNANPSREEIVTEMNGVLCRCGTYNRIIKAIQRASIQM